MLFQINDISGILNNPNVHELKRNKPQFMEDVVILSGDLKSSMNFRIYVDNHAEVRNGMAEKYTGTAMHSFWTDMTQTLGLFVDGVNLMRLNSDYTATSLYASLTASKRMTYMEHRLADKQGQYIVYMGNTEQMLKHNRYDGTVSAWGDTTNLDSEFEEPLRQYCTPPKSNIIHSYRARTYVIDGKFLLYSESGRPETFRKANNIPLEEEGTAISSDNENMYIHSLNSTLVLSGFDPDDFTYSRQDIGVIKHGSINPYGKPVCITKKGWAICEGGMIAYVDYDNFRLDLSDLAEAYMGYDPINNEVIARILQ